MYAIFKSGGKQYKVSEKDVVKLEKLEGKIGDIIKISPVLAIQSVAGDVQIGAPEIVDAVVSAQILEQKKDKKVIIFKKKRRHNYRRKNGHRQQITVVRILDVSGKGEEKIVINEKKLQKPHLVEAVVEDIKSQKIDAAESEKALETLSAEKIAKESKKTIKAKTAVEVVEKKDKNAEKKTPASKKTKADKE